MIEQHENFKWMQKQLAKHGMRLTRDKVIANSFLSGGQIAQYHVVSPGTAHHSTLIIQDNDELGLQVWLDTPADYGKVVDAIVFDKFFDDEEVI